MAETEKCQECGGSGVVVIAGYDPTWEDERRPLDTAYPCPDCSEDPS